MDQSQSTDETMIARFIERAEAVAAKVTRVADEAAAEKLVAEIQAAEGAEHVGVARAAKGIADTGTCVVVTDDEETRLKTMLPETTVFILRAADRLRALLQQIAPSDRDELRLFLAPGSRITVTAQ